MSSHPDTVVASAPGRVNLIGEHTDYNGGLALPMAIAQRVTVTLRPRRDRIVGVTSAAPGMSPAEFPVDSEPGQVDGWAVHVAGVFWALRTAGRVVPGADVEIKSDVPVGAGLSSSHALECALLVALDRQADLGLDRTDIARLAQRAENGYVGAPTGLMDQMAAMYGQEGCAILFDADQVSADPIPCDLPAAGLALLVVDTKAPHRHADGEYGARRHSCEAAARTLGVSSLRAVQADPVEGVLTQLEDEITQRRVRHVLTENNRVLDTVRLLRAGRIRDIGALLTASHVSLRDDYEVTVAQLDVAVDAALAAGALGARMTGGGFGGSIIALVDAERTAPVTDRIRAEFAARGFTAPQAFTAVPSAGAGVDQ
ncbi:galactokinase [Phytoactinopolyspora limicola]|uniref:galactokinase n=1 Tax=Phytoactinopolyspora limicola TaxID=2715536 RepID=UPI001A9C2A52|nr:galactokinase [Phytoactinopolyspora limicola]